MADQKPKPTVDETGIPRCTLTRCPMFDGKGCRDSGLQPESICEPAVRTMASELVALRTKASAFTEASRHG